MRYFTQIKALLWKDLVSEFRTREMVSSMLIFSFLVTVVFSFAFEPDSETVKQVFPGIIWVAFIFAGILGLNRSFINEKSNDCIMGLMSAAVDKGVIFLGKMTGNFIFMIVMEAVTLPILFVLFDYRMKGSPASLILVVILGTQGFVAVGTFLSALSVNTRNSEVLLPIILFPLITPLLIAAVKATGIILTGGEFAEWSNWLTILLAFDIIFTIIPWFLVDYVLEV